MKNTVKVTVSGHEDATDEDVIIKEAEKPCRPGVIPLETPVPFALRQAREKSGQDLLQVSQALRISRTYLQSMEEGNVSGLPERVYTLGFLRSYAGYLGLDIEDTVRRFKIEVLAGASNTSYSVMEPVSENRLPQRSLALAFALIVPAVLLGGWWYLGREAPIARVNTVPAQIHSEIVARTASEIEVVPDNQTALAKEREQNFVSKPDVDHVLDSPAPVVVDHREKVSASELETTPRESQPTENTPTAPTTGSEIISRGVFLEFTEPSWVEIRNEKGVQILNHTFKSGDKYFLDMHEGWHFSTGNAGGIRVSREGNEPFLLGKKGQVLKGLPQESLHFQKP